MTNSQEMLRPFTVPFGFYLSARQCSKPNFAEAAADAGGSVTIGTAKGPTVLRQLRNSGLTCPALFDGQGYDPKSNVPPPGEWVAAQTAAGAQFTLMPGAFVDWGEANAAAFEEIVLGQSKQAGDLGATVLLAIDARWVAKRSEVVIDLLQSVPGRVAVVLADRADPLSVGGAVQSLRQLAMQLGDRLVILRSDHGAVGALAFGAAYASIGLLGSTRHYAPRPMRGHRRTTPISRVFVPSLLDWFLADKIAGWTAAGASIACSLSCCGGQSLARFLDPDEDEVQHNMTALAHFAYYVLNADPQDRPGVFRQEISNAVASYGLAEFNGPEDPKRQLTGWALV